MANRKKWAREFDPAYFVYSSLIGVDDSAELQQMIDEEFSKAIPKKTKIPPTLIVVIEAHVELYDDDENLLDDFKTAFSAGSEISEFQPLLEEHFSELVASIRNRSLFSSGRIAAQLESEKISPAGFSIFIPKITFYVETKTKRAKYPLKKTGKVSRGKAKGAIPKAKKKGNQSRKKHRDSRPRSKSRPQRR